MVIQRMVTWQQQPAAAVTGCAPRWPKLVPEKAMPAQEPEQLRQGASSSVLWLSSFLPTVWCPS